MEALDRTIREKTEQREPMHPHVTPILPGESEDDHKDRCIAIMAKRWAEHRDIWTGRKLTLQTTDDND